MARPRVFLSSTCFDLKQIRADLDRFVRDLGYETVLSERGQVPYGSQEALEQYCYREISSCDILIHVVGGRFGSESKIDPDHSISQVELQTAHKLNKQLYVFVERPVHVEYRTYLRNESNANFIPHHVDNVRVYHFLREIYGLPSNNTIADFDSAADIIAYLKEQWAGLFQRFLQENARREDYRISVNLHEAASLLEKASRTVTRERDEALRRLLSLGHPVFDELMTHAQLPISVPFRSSSEMSAMLEAFGFAPCEDEEPRVFQHERTQNDKRRVLSVSRSLFDSGGWLIPASLGSWSPDLVYHEEEEVDTVPF